MSRSWSELRARESGGIAIGRDYIACARVEQLARRQITVRALTHCRLGTQLFCGAPDVASRERFTDAVTNVARDLRGRYVPVHVSLPDAAVRTVVMELEQLPANARSLGKLVEFRVARENGKPAQRCAWQVLGRVNGRHLLLVMSADDSWLDLVLEGLDAAGIVPWSVSVNGLCQFNHFASENGHSAGALLAVAADAWSLWVWDANGVPRHVRAQWRDIANDTDMLVEVRRSIVAYTEGSGETIDRVLLACDDEHEEVANSLDRQLREPCVRLPLMSGLALDDSIEREIPAKGAALAAALGR